ncbi:MAG TPA: MerR family transcriptional regulator [Phototrophicaceae bacterium]|jgi:DNA-binding transcriptional MerR regulator|nr:MerR family transcriptional regulator [Phototrophicaceae bacterium]
MNTLTERLTIQQVAMATGLSVYTLRYYERIGLIHRIHRHQNSHRRYTMDDIGWIDFLNKLRATGMSIQQMQAYSELQRQGDETLPERLEMLKQHQHKVEAHVSELQNHLNIIHSKIEYYSSVLSDPCNQVETDSQPESEETRETLEAL